MFDDIAEFYALFSDTEARTQREMPFLAKCLADAPGKRVADVACGTGFHAALLHGLGADIRAFDLSEGMVAYARGQHPDIAQSIAQGDMCAVRGGPYDMVVCLGNSLSLLPDTGAVSTFFASTHDALVSGGTLVVQVLNYALPANGNARHRVERTGCDGCEIVAVKNLVPLSDQYTLLNLCFSVRDAEGIRKSITDAAVIQHFSAEFLEKCAWTAGYAAAQFHGGYDGHEYGATSSSDLIGVFHA
jgi:SAM-dependent methyltransferase